MMTKMMIWGFRGYGTQNEVITGTNDTKYHKNLKK